jgi:hypothetical protein
MNVRKLIAMALMGVVIVFNLHNAALAGERRGQHGPPPEAYTACEGKSEGDTASFESPRGDTITGTCAQEKNGDRLVLRPDNPPDRDRSDNKNE